MGDSEQKASAAVADANDRRARGGKTARSERGAAAPSSAPRHSGGSPLRVYKPGQGAYVRWGSAIGGAVMAVGGAQFLYEQMGGFTESIALRTLVPVALLVVLGYLVFRLVGQSHGVVDFMIATEGEMKKVNWSSRKEVFGATRVVIVMVLALGFILFAVNLLFILLFSSIGVLKIPIFQNLFGRSEAGV